MTRLDMYLIAFLLQIPIFIVARLVLFILFELLTCCCDKGRANDLDLDDEDRMKRQIFHYDYVDYMNRQLGNFRHHPVGRAEIAYNRNLELVRAQTIRERRENHAGQNADQPGGEVRLQQSRLGPAKGLAGTIYQRLSRSQRSECVLCYE